MNTANLSSNKIRRGLMGVTAIFILAQVIIIMALVQHPRAGVLGTPFWRAMLVLISWIPLAYGLMSFIEVRRSAAFSGLKDQEILLVQRKFLTGIDLSYLTIMLFMSFLFF
jgi:hypothetical protein